MFRFRDGRTLTYTAEGDCCSQSWIEHITVPPDIDGAVVATYSETDIGERSDGRAGLLRLYQTAFQTDRGEVIVEYRNSSNGYYGGWLRGPAEKWAVEEIERLRDASR